VEHQSVARDRRLEVDEVVRHRGRLDVHAASFLHVKLEAKPFGLLGRYTGSTAARFHYELNTPTTNHVQGTKALSFVVRFAADAAAHAGALSCGLALSSRRGLTRPELGLVGGRLRGAPRNFRNLPPVFAHCTR
jgi:hypothetical protein